MENQNKTDMNKTDFDDYFKVWKYYEDVAMHFNDLIIRLRIQSIGGLAAIVTIVGLISKCTNNSGSFNYLLAMVSILCLMLLWIAVWVLDMRYYNRLLEGAVSAILELEKDKETFLRNREIDLSSNIGKAFKVKFEHEVCKTTKMGKNEIRKNFIDGRHWFYGIVLGVLVILLLGTLSMYIFAKPDKNTSGTDSNTQNISFNTVSLMPVTNLLATEISEAKSV